MCVVVELTDRTLGSAVGDTSFSYRELVRIADSIISVALAVGPISRLLTRQMYLAIESRSAWDHTLRFSAALLEESRFWYNIVNSFNRYSLLPPPGSSTVVFSDASDVALGGVSASLDGVTASGMFRFKDLGIDALAQDWSAENNWICPPVRLIVDSVRHLISYSGRGTLIIPEWPSA